jgi:hypothetical protein
MAPTTESLADQNRVRSAFRLYTHPPARDRGPHHCPSESTDGKLC